MVAQAAAPEPRDLHRELELRGRALVEEKSYPLPSEVQIDAAERALGQQPCIGRLSRWHRTYIRQVDWENGRVDPDLVWFNYREAGRQGYHAGRKIGRLADLELDDRRFRMASGTYNLRTHAVKVDECGWSAPQWPLRRR